MNAFLVKRAIVMLVMLPPIRAILERVLRRGPAIFTLHRFENRDLGVEGHSLDALRANLALVRRLGHQVLPIEAFIKGLVDGSLPARAVSFTVDDGYRGFITHGAPVFAEFDCPVTLFAATGFVDGAYWFWWDQLEHVFEHTRRVEFTVDVDGHRLSFAWRAPAERQAVWQSLVLFLKGYRPEVQRRAVADIAAALQVDLPAAAPIKYAPMSWSECRALAASGVSVGPHSVTHCNLAKATAEEAHWEIHESWRRVREASDAPAPVLCYPYGDATSFGAREQELARAEGMVGALSFMEGKIGWPATDADQAKFALPRTRYHDDTHVFAQQVVGFDTLKSRIRRASGAQASGSRANNSGAME